MRTSSEIRKKLKQARFKHLKKHLETNLRCRPTNCKWNSTQRYIHEGTGQLKIIGMCMYSVEDPKWEIDICETEATARDCPNFIPLKNKEQLKEEFSILEQDEEFSHLHFREVTTLKWVLNGDDSARIPTVWERIQSWLISLLLKSNVLNSTKKEQKSLPQNHTD